MTCNAPAGMSRTAWYGEKHNRHGAVNGWLATSAQNGGIGMDECVALANWGQPDHWLLYDPRGVIREGMPGYVVMLADPLPIAGLTDALRRLEDAAHDVLATN